MGSSISLDKSDILGRGGFGCVFKSIWKGKAVAVKRILLEDNDQREEDALKMLDHPNIVKLIHLDGDKTFRYYVLELCKASLDMLFFNDDNPKKYSGPMPPKMDVLIQLETGLEYIHEKKYVHRDIKPENVLIWVGDDGTVLMKWADFGLSKQVKATKFTHSVICGTREWLAPETLKQIEEVKNLNTEETTLYGTTKSDIYAEGLIFAYFLSGGKHPFGTTTLHIQINIIKNQPDQSHINNIKPKILQEAILSKMLASDPDQRNNSSEILKYLELLKKNEIKMMRLCKTISTHLLEDLQILFRQGVDVNCKDQKGLTPLLILLNEKYNKENLLEIVRLLIEHGIDIHCKTNDGWNALHFLCIFYSNDNLIDIVRLLIQHGIDINCKRNDGCNALLLLCSSYSRDNFIDIVRLLIQQGIDINCKTNEVGWNALLVLCWRYSKENLIDIVRLLIEHRIDINCKLKDGLNALHILCEIYPNDNLIDIVRLLIQHGIDINCKHKDGSNALHILCCRYSNENLIDIVRLLIQHKIDINCQDKDNDNSLHILCQFYSNDNLIDIVRLLIEHRIDINCKTNDGRNALHILCRYYSNENLIDIVRLLIEHRIDINCNDKDGLNALHILCELYSKDNLIDIVRVLLKNGIAVKYNDFDAREILLFNYKKENVEEILKMLDDVCGEYTH